MFRFGGFGFGGRRGFKKAQPKKIPKENWFERLNQSQLKELLEAALLKKTGNKKEQIGRLLESETTASYGSESKRGGFGGFSFVIGADGMTVEDLKRECGEKLLTKGGTKFELVLRLVRHKSGSGGPQKRAACEEGPDGELVAKKRKPNTAKANLPALSRRIEGKIFCNTDKWSNHKHKQHFTAVVDCANTILEKEAFGKGFVAQADPFALEVAAAVLAPLRESYQSANGIGYCDMEVESLARSLKQLGLAMPRDGDGGESDALLDEVRGHVEALHSGLSAYGIESLEGVAAAFLCVDDEEEEAEEAERAQEEHEVEATKEPLGVAAASSAATPTGGALSPHAHPACQLDGATASTPGCLVPGANGVDVPSEDRGVTGPGAICAGAATSTAALEVAYVLY
mmetsp:Transcript_86705/g.167939  ORF Transcript_86705/g.167939 Transcript_86705/m.167939 type:complete len:400 (-) Transcript_86705:66-1265(-)